MLSTDVTQQKSTIKQFIVILTKVLLIKMHLQLNDRLDAYTCAHLWF